MNIKTYYLTAFQSDNLGEEINANATFDGLFKNITEPYSYIGVDDSIVRERVFDKLATIKGVPYGDIYNLWMEKRWPQEYEKRLQYHLPRQGRQTSTSCNDRGY